jgi:hypothetical protein
MTRGRFRSIAAGAVVLISLLCFSCDNLEPDDPSLHNDKRYSLFTWHSAESQICFALIPRSERGRFLRRWWPKRAGNCGLDNLKAGLGGLPKDIEVLWEEVPRRGFTFPSADMMDEIKRFAKDNAVNVVYAPVLD